MQSHPSINLPETRPLWPEGQVPLASDHDGVFPRFTYYLPSEEYRHGASVLILPGGGYGRVSTPKEGHRPAQRLASHGIAAAVLEYRHAPQRHPVPLLDAQRGLRTLRHLAHRHNLDPQKVGVLGFSAGGHLAGTLATQNEIPEGRVPDALDDIAFRPDFAALVYPVVSMTAAWSHSGSRDHLLGLDADPDLAAQLSLENAVTQDTPPMFLFHTAQDSSVPALNALRLAEALIDRGVEVDLHLVAGGGHGIGLARNHPWSQWLVDWIAAR